MLNLDSRSPSSFIEWLLSTVRGRRQPLPNEAGAKITANDIFTTSSSTDFACAYITCFYIVLSHCDLVQEICFVIGK